MLVQPDGRIAIAGKSPAGKTVSRLKPDGTPDGTEFDYVDTGYVTSAALAPDGKIVVASYAGTPARRTTTSWSRASSPEGPLDPSLGGTGRVQFGPKNRDDVPAAVLVQPDGKIVVAQESGTTTKHMAVMRLRVDGSPDTTFAGDGTATPEFVGETFTAGAALQPDGKILVAGTLGSERDFIAARLQPDGSPDRSFGTDGKAQVAFEDISLAYAAGMDPDGRFVIAGWTVAENRTVIRTAVARVLADQPPAQPGTGDGGQQPGTVGGDARRRRRCRSARASRRRSSARRARTAARHAEGGRDRRAGRRRPRALGGPRRRGLRRRGTRPPRRRRRRGPAARRGRPRRADRRRGP